MTLESVLDQVEREGIHLTAAGDRLVVDAPVGSLTPELRDALMRHKPALLARLASPRAFVTLINGPTLPVEAIELALELERRGFRMTLDAAEQFAIESTRMSGPLTDDDRAAIARWRLHLSAILAYQAPSPEWLQ